MKSLSSSLKSHYASGTTTVATCWRATLLDGTVVAATSLDRDLVIGGVTYKAAQAYNPSDIESASELNPDNLEVEGFLASPAITTEDIHSGRWDFAQIDVFEVNYNDLAAGKNIIRKGTLGEVRGGRSKFTAELRGIMQAYTRTIVRITTKECIADFGDAKCGINLAAWTVTGSVGGVTSNRVIADPARAEAAEYFTGGKLTFTTGQNTGLSMEVKKYTPGLIELHQPFYFPIAEGDQYSMHAGCQKRFTEDCKGRYGNQVNFRGFPHLPGTNVYRSGMIDYGDSTSAPSDGETGGGGTGGETGGGSSPPAETRNALLQPFASTSIWNMPIGSGAVYVPANLDPTPADNIYAYMPGVDTERICLTPTAPLTEINYSNVAWGGGDRCPATNPSDPPLDSVPMPADFLIPNSNRNEGGVFLRADGRTIVQAQPIARCSAGSYATALLTFPDVDLYGSGITGGHGGSGLSSIGGSIRVGELRPGQQGPKHALKVNVYAKAALYKCATRAQGYRWPATTSDSYAVGWYGVETNNLNTAMKMGALLAIPASVDINSLGLVTEPAKQLAWTLQNYGAYIVDDAYAPGFDFSVEEGYHGSKPDEFLADWGFPMAQKVETGSQWVQDIQTLVAALHVVDNNSASSIGGGGAPRQPLAPAITPP